MIVVPVQTGDEHRASQREPVVLWRRLLSPGPPGVVHVRVLGAELFNADFPRVPSSRPIDFEAYCCSRVRPKGPASRDRVSAPKGDWVRAEAVSLDVRLKAEVVNYSEVVQGAVSVQLPNDGDGGHPRCQRGGGEEGLHVIGPRFDLDCAEVERVDNHANLAVLTKKQSPENPVSEHRDGLKAVVGAGWELSEEV